MTMVCFPITWHLLETCRAICNTELVKFHVLCRFEKRSFLDEALPELLPSFLPLRVSFPLSAPPCLYSNSLLFTCSILQGSSIDPLYGLRFDRPPFETGFLLITSSTFPDFTASILRRYFLTVFRNIPVSLATLRIEPYSS